MKNWINHFVKQMCTNKVVCLSQTLTMNNLKANMFVCFECTVWLCVCRRVVVCLCVCSRTLHIAVCLCRFIFLEVRERVRLGGRLGGRLEGRLSRRG